MSAGTVPNEVGIVEGRLAPEAAHRMPGLDGVRAVCAGCVFVSHLMANGKLPKVGWVPDGLLAVLVFFALSGFLMGGIVSRERSAGTFSAGGFLLRRAARIWPAALLFVGVLAAGSAAGWLPAMSWRGLAGAAGMLINYVPTGDRHELFGHMWSLGIEVQFYLFVAVMNLVVPSRVAVRGVLAGACLLVAYHFVRSPVLATRPGSSALFLLLGYGAGYGWATGVPWVLRAGRVPVVLAFAAWWGVCLLPYHRALEVELAVVTAGLILVVAGHGDRAAFLSWGPLRWVGERSYGFYLWQELFAFPPAATRLPVWALLPLPVIVAHLSFTFLERPITRGVARWLGSRRKMVAP